MIPSIPVWRTMVTGGVGWDWFEIQKLTGRIGDNFSELDGPIGRKNILPRTFISPQLAYGDYGKWSFFCCSEGGLKGSTCCYGCVFNEEKHHAVITLSLWTAYEYWQSCARLFHPPFCHEVLAAEGQNCCTTDDEMEYGPLHCTTLPPPLLPVGLLVHIT